MIFVLSLISGAIGGMGIGGGVVLIPVLTGFFGISQKNAQYINLLYFIPLSLCALFVHTKNGRVEWKKAIFMAIGGATGAWVGSWAASVVRAGFLRKIFGIFLLVVGIDQLRCSKSQKKF